MALRVIEGFEFLRITPVSATNTNMTKKFPGEASFGSNVNNYATGRYGGIAGASNGSPLILDTGNGTLTNNEIWFVGFAIKWTGFETNNRNLVQFQTAGGTAQFQVQVRPTESQLTGGLNLRFMRGAFTFSQVQNLRPNIWHFFEFKVRIHTTSGYFEFRQNGVERCTYTDINTANAGTNGAARIQIEWEADSSDSVLLDDLYICDDTGGTFDDYLGNVFVDSVNPSADGSQLDWTPNSGSIHYTTIDDHEFPNISTPDFISSTTTGHIDLIRFEEPKLTRGSILAVSLEGLISETGGSDNVEFIHFQNEVQSNGDTKAVTSTTTQWRNQIWTEDPASNLPWTLQDLQASEFGVENVA